MFESHFQQYTPPAERNRPAYDILPWRRAVDQQANYHIFQRLLGTKRVPPSIRPAFYKLGTEHRSLRSSEIARQQAWEQALEERVRELLREYTHAADQVRLPSQLAFGEYAKPVQKDHIDPDVLARKKIIDRLLQTSLLENPVLFQRVSDRIEDAKDELQEAEDAYLIDKQPDKEQEELKKQAASYFAALDLFESPFIAKKVDFETQQKIDDLGNDPSLLEEIRRYRDRAREGKKILDDQLTPRDRAIKERYRLEQEFDKAKGSNRERLRALLDADNERDPFEEPVTQPMDAFAGDTNVDSTPPAYTLERGENHTESDADEAAYRERKWAEGYFRALSYLDNPKFAYGLNPEDQVKLNQLKANLGLLTEIRRLRNKFREELYAIPAAARQERSERARQIKIRQDLEQMLDEELAQPPDRASLERRRILQERIDAADYTF